MGWKFERFITDLPRMPGKITPVVIPKSKIELAFHNLSRSSEDTGGGECFFACEMRGIPSQRDVKEMTENDEFPEIHLVEGGRDPLDFLTDTQLEDRANDTSNPLCCTSQGEAELALTFRKEFGGLKERDEMNAPEFLAYRKQILKDAGVEQD